MSHAADLAAWAEQRDEAAFNRLVAHHTDLVAAVCRRQLGADVAVDEACQAVFIVLAKRAAEIRDPSRLSAWLYGVALRVCRHLRHADARRYRRQEHAREAMSTIPEPGHAEAGPAWMDLRPHLDEAIASLSAAQREAVIVRFLEGQSYASVAQRLGISEDSARMRCTYALGKLRDWFRKGGLAIGSGALAAGLASEAGATEPALATACAHAALHPAAGAEALAANAMAGGGGTLAAIAAAWKAWLIGLGLAAATAATLLIARAPSVGTAPPRPAPAAPPSVPAIAADPPDLSAHYPGDVGIGRDPSVLFADDFEGGDFSRWSDQDGNPAPDNQIVSDPGLVHGGRRAAQLQSTPGAAVMIDLVTWLAQGRDLVHARWYCRFAEDYQPGDYPIAGGGCLVGARERWMLNNTAHEPNGQDYVISQLLPDPRAAVQPGDLVLRSNQLGIPRDVHDEFFAIASPAVPASLQRARWYCLETMLRMNTPGQADGEQAFWVDGVLKLRQTGIRWRTAGDLRINAFWLTFYPTDHQRMNRMWLDDVVVATRYIGPIATP